MELHKISARRNTIRRYRVRLLALANLGFIIFLALTLVNVRNPHNAVDRAVWDFFVSIRAGWIDPVVSFFTQAFNTLPDIIYSLVAIIAIGLWRKSWWPLLTIAGSVILAPLTMVAVKNVLSRSRPPLMERLIDETSFSFPSGHSTGIAALVVSIYLAVHAVLSRRLRVVVGILLAALAVAVAISRLYVGVHWFSDILAGLTLGGTVTCLVYAIFPQILVPDGQ